MKQILLGNDSNTLKPVHIPYSAFPTHFHLIGGTGKGKTTAIHTILHPILRDYRERPSVFIFDRMGNLSTELLLWMASRYSSQAIRDRLVYIEPAREDVVLGFNPLLHDTPAHGYYKVARATDIILRAWESVNIEAMPRLARWTFNSFWAAAQLGLTIADCSHFLMPWSDLHQPLMACLPDRLRYEWAELINTRSSEVVKILESTRNRLKPYFESDILRRMFGATTSRLDVGQFMSQGKIVILNLSPQGRLSTQLSDAIGALVLNEVLSTARSLRRIDRHPTFLLLDEFQNFIGPDIESALPEVRQLNLRLILAHQSMSQLERGDYDLTSMIFQAQSRMIFGLQGEDADLVAHELASIRYDPKRIKDEVYSRRQLVSGHRIIELSSTSTTEGLAESWNESYGQGWGRSENVTHQLLTDIKADGKSSNRNTSEGRGGSSNSSTSHSRGQHVLAEYEKFMELASRTYYTFDDQKNLWARDVRRLQTGRCLLRLVDDPEIYSVDVQQSRTGYLGWEEGVIEKRAPAAYEAYRSMIELNFQSEIFASPQEIDRETELRLARVLQPSYTIMTKPAAQALSAPGGEANDLA